MIEKNKTMHVYDVGILDLMPCLTLPGLYRSRGPPSLFDYYYY